MTAIYEFQVSGLVGSVIRSALPEMQTFEQASGRTLRGTADERGEIDRLLELIQTMNLVLQRLQICVRRESGLDHDVPVIDHGGSQDDIL